MFKTILMAGVAGGLVSAASAAAPMAEADVSLGKVSNQYICRFDASVSRSQVGAEAARAAGAMGQVIHTYRNTIRGFAVRMPAQPGSRSHVAELRANNPKVTGCEQDQIVKALAPPPGKGPGGGGTQPGEEVPWGIARVGGPGNTSSNAAWVIDSGIDLDHPDLVVDVQRSVTYVGGTPDDENGHGTHVAGTIAAIGGNSIGVVGVSPGTTVVSVRVLNRRGSGTWSGVIAGVDYVGEHARGGDVANMSLGGGASDTVDDAVKCAADGPSSNVSGCDHPGGIKFTLAAGNDGDLANSHSPARAEGANIYTVSASDLNNAMPSWSNFGNPPVDWAEPGVSIKSTYKGGGYNTLSGTSMAAPHLAGILVQGGVTQCRKADGNPLFVSNDKDNNPDKIGCH